MKYLLLFLLISCAQVQRTRHGKRIVHFEEICVNGVVYYDSPFHEYALAVKLTQKGKIQTCK